MQVFVGDDWPEDRHDIELQDETGQVLARRRLPEGIAGITSLHELVGGQHRIGDPAPCTREKARWD